MDSLYAYNLINRVDDSLFYSIVYCFHIIYSASPPSYWYQNASSSSCSWAAAAMAPPCLAYTTPYPKLAFEGLVP